MKDAVRLSTVHLICGKIGSGKSHYAAALTQAEGAVIFGCDEITLLLPPLGERHDEVTEKLREWLAGKAAQVALRGVPVILDWGFWQADYRKRMTSFFRERGLAVCWHYIDVSDDILRRHVMRRNESGGGYFVDEGLMQKCLSLFEPPDRAEMDEWVIPEE